MSTNTITDQRTELMVVSPNTRMLQVARFLVPTLSMRTPPNRPSEPTSIMSTLPVHLQKVSFLGWVDPKKNWMDWVAAMKLVHSHVWKTAGIHDAIMHSLLKLPKDESLLLWFAEKWSPKTNTFILPWGEITITLEDMMVLGGFHVLGGPATCHVENPEEHVALNKLKEVYQKIVRSHLKKASFCAWINEFMGRQTAHEHEAFLALWLSKYLFPSMKDTVLPETFHLAILLARGWRIALAPAVLATLYRDLHVLQNAILDVQQRVKETVVQEVFSPMYYIQVWIWERFPYVMPYALDKPLNKETRLHRWVGLNYAIDFGTLDDGTCEEYFVWRPYANDTNHFISLRVYDRYGSWTRIDNEEVESYARCLRACKLVGLDNLIQDYSPNRVCRQFGYAQDIPADILRIEDIEDAWLDYSTPLLNGSLYIPSREFEGHVSVRYEGWWEKEPVSPSDPRVPLPPKRRRKRISAY